MANEKIKPDGIITFQPRENAPEFVLGTMVITIEDLTEFFNRYKEFVTQYNGKDQLKFNILKGDYGVYFNLDTYKPKTDGNSQPQKSSPQQQASGNSNYASSIPQNHDFDTSTPDLDDGSDGLPF